jgi:hypothetical protein
MKEQNQNNRNNNKTGGGGYTEFKIYSGIYGKVTRFGLEIYDWGLFIFFVMLSILLLKKIIIIAIVLDAAVLIFLKKYKKNKPDFYTSSLLSFMFAKKELYVLDPEQDKKI